MDIQTIYFAVNTTRTLYRPVTDEELTVIGRKPFKTEDYTPASHEIEHWIIDSSIKLSRQALHLQYHSNGSLTFLLVTDINAIRLNPTAPKTPTNIPLIPNVGITLQSNQLYNLNLAIDVGERNLCLKIIEATRGYVAFKRIF